MHTYNRLSYMGHPKSLNKIKLFAYWVIFMLFRRLLLFDPKPTYSKNYFMNTCIIRHEVCPTWCCVQNCLQRLSADSNSRQIVNWHGSKRNHLRHKVFWIFVVHIIHNVFFSWRGSPLLLNETHVIAIKTCISLHERENVRNHDII